MLSIQYLNKRLTKKHIEKILSNYTIKYTTMKKEIENKVNVMIKTFTEDISAFLNNMEEIAEEKEKLKSLTNNQNELESLREEMKFRNHEESELRRQIELLTMENNRLRSSANNKNTINNPSSRKKYCSSNRENYNSMSNYNSPNVRSPTKKGSNLNSLLLKTDRKDNKRNLDNRIFKSPQNTQLKKTKKISQTKLEKKNTNLLKKTEKSKTNKTILGYNSADVRTEPNPNFNSNKGILGKSKQTLNNNRKKTTFKLPVKNETQKKTEVTKKVLNRTVNNFNKIKEEPLNTNTINKPDSISIKHDSEDSSSESSSYSKSVNKSRITSVDYEEENTIIDEEISEMNYFEDEITSLMEEIREFKKNNDEINNDKDKTNEENKSTEIENIENKVIENKNTEIENSENKVIDNKNTEIENSENKVIENKNTEIENSENKVIDNKEIKENKENNENKDKVKNKGEKKGVTFKVP